VWSSKPTSLSVETLDTVTVAGGDYRYAWLCIQRVRRQLELSRLGAETAVHANLVVGQSIEDYDGAAEPMPAAP
jgi:hypothetical protein